jgi:hypothetical protein
VLHISAALAHLGERQTEVNFCPSCPRKSILEALCSIHRSGIAFAVSRVVTSLLLVNFFQAIRSSLVSSISTGNSGRIVLVQAQVVSGVRTEILHGNAFVGADGAESHCFRRTPLERPSEAAFTNLDVPPSDTFIPHPHPCLPVRVNNTYNLVLVRKKKHPFSTGFLLRAIYHALSITDTLLLH